MTPEWPPPGGDVTLAEVYRTLRQFREDVHRDFVATNTRIDQLQMVHPETFEAARVDVERRLTAIEAFRDWTVRLVLSAVILAVLGVVLVTAGGTP